MRSVPSSATKIRSGTPIWGATQPDPRRCAHRVDHDVDEARERRTSEERWVHVDGALPENQRTGLPRGGALRAAASNRQVEQRLEPTSAKL